MRILFSANQKTGKLPCSENLKIILTPNDSDDSYECHSYTDIYVIHSSFTCNYIYMNLHTDVWYNLCINVLWVF